MTEKVLFVVGFLFCIAALLDGVCYLIYGAWVHEGPRLRREHHRYGRVLLAIAAVPVHGSADSVYATEAQTMKQWANLALTGKGGGDWNPNVILAAMRKRVELPQGLDRK